MGKKNKGEYVVVVTWDEYHKEIETLAKQIHQSGIRQNQIVCIAKGGLRIGDVLSRLFDQPLAILSVASYFGKKRKDEAGDIIFSRELSKTTIGLGSRILLVDDLVDSGRTLAKSRDWLTHYYGFYVEKIWTAVIWYKERSIIVPDFYNHRFAGDSPPWIVQPFTKYEEMHIEDL